MPGTPPFPPVLPDYGGACIANVVPALLGGEPAAESAGWIPEPVHHASQFVLLVLDGLGWEQLRARATLAPALNGAVGIDCAITSVAPTTTACALTSITTGLAPSRHGLLGYRLALEGEILNALRWTLGSNPPRDGRQRVPARGFQTQMPFAAASRPVPVVSRSEFAGTGFTAAHLGDAPIHGYKVLSSLAPEVGSLVRAGEPFVYAYYDGIDKVAHTSGLGELYDAELRAVDRMVADVADELPPHAVLVVTADHGQIDVGPEVELLGPDLMDLVHFLSGEGRFRWLHARPGAAGELLDAARRYAGTTWVKSREELIDEGLFGGPLEPAFVPRIGDVALIPHAAIAFVDPADTGESRLVSRHGSLTPEEMLVPLVVLSGGDNI